jgi:hypothetical protein
MEVAQPYAKLGWHREGGQEEIAKIAKIAGIARIERRSQWRRGDREINPGVESYKPFRILVKEAGGGV